MYAVESLGTSSAEMGLAINFLMHISKVYSSIWMTATDRVFYMSFVILQRSNFDYFLVFGPVKLICAEHTQTCDRLS